MEIFVKKVGMTYDVPKFEDLPKQSQEYIIDFGWKQALGDAAASVKFKDAPEYKLDALRDEADRLIQKRLDNIVAGVLRAGGGRTSDPVAQEARKIAIAKVKAAPGYLAWLNAEGLKAADKAAVDKLAELAKELAKREDIVALAKFNVEGIADLEVEINI